MEDLFKSDKWHKLCHFTALNTDLVNETFERMHIFYRKKSVRCFIPFSIRQQKIKMGGRWNRYSFQLILHRFADLLFILALNTLERVKRLSGRTLSSFSLSTLLKNPTSAVFCLDLTSVLKFI